MSSTATADLTTVNASSTDVKRLWIFEKYTGAAACGYRLSGPAKLIAGTSGEWHVSSWSTRINYDTAELYFYTEYMDVASSRWEGDVKVLTIHDEGYFDMDVRIGWYDMTFYDIFTLTYNTFLPVEEGTYFFKNSEYSAYMQIDNNASSPTNNGAIMELWSFDGADDQRWNLEHVVDGYYKIGSVASGKALTAPSALDDSVTQTTYTEAYNQLWYIDINSDGTVSLIPSSSYGNRLAAGDGIFTSDGRNVELRSERSDGKNEWYIFKKKDYTLMYIGYEEGDVLMPPILDSVESALMNNAYMNGYAYTSMNTNDLLMYMSSSKIYSCITHGSPTTIVTSDGHLTISNVNSLDNNAFDSLQFVYLGACETGYGGASGNNLVNAIYNKGADTVFGIYGIGLCRRN